jgi:hypothetical protein
MTDVSDVQAEVLNFQEEARGCLQLAQGEALHEVRTVLVGMAIGWLKLGNQSPRPFFSLSSPKVVEEERWVEKAVSGVPGCSTFIAEMGDYYSIVAKAVGALDRNTGDARRRLYERARAALIAELRSADVAPDLSDMMTAQMLLELAIGEVEADAQRHQHCRQTVDAPSTHSPQGTKSAHEPKMASKAALHSRDFAPRSFAELMTA